MPVGQGGPIVPPHLSDASIGRVPGRVCTSSAGIVERTSLEVRRETMSVVDRPSSFTSPPDGSRPPSFYSSLLPACCQPYTSETPPVPSHPHSLPAACLLPSGSGPCSPVLPSWPTSTPLCRLSPSLWSPSRMASVHRNPSGLGSLYSKDRRIAPLSSLET